jgi:hypothetical protein
MSFYCVLPHYKEQDAPLGDAAYSSISRGYNAKDEDNQRKSELNRIFQNIVGTRYLPVEVNWITYLTPEFV